MTDLSKSWRLLYELRLQMRKRYRNVWRIPLKRRAVDVVRRHARDGMAVLDVGGSHKFWEGRRGRLPALDVKTLNIDPEEQCEYRSLDEVADTFDLVLMLETIEHLTLDEGLEMLGRLRGRVKPEGKLIVTTPNIFHPDRFMDTTHITPWRYDELGAAVMGRGFEVTEVWRLYNANALDRWTRKTIGVWLHRYLGIDFAPSIAVVAQPCLRT